MPIQNISPLEAQKLLSSGEAILIDVREPDEFAAQHIPYALSLPLGLLEERFSSLDIPSDKKLIFQCLKGARGEKACLRVSDKNLSSHTIMNMEGGISGWTEAGLPLIAQAKQAGISIFRQVQIIAGGLIAFFIFLGLMGLTIFLVIAGLMAIALFTAGLTGWCGLAMLLQKMPWNKT